MSVIFCISSLQVVVAYDIQYYDEQGNPTFNLSTEPSEREGLTVQYFNENGDLLTETYYPDGVENSEGIITFDAQDEPPTFGPQGTEDFTTYSIYDPNVLNKITTTTDRVTITNADRDDPTCAYKDFGTGFFSGDGFSIDFDLNITSTANQGICDAIILGNNAVDLTHQTNATYLYLYKQSTFLEIALKEFHGTVHSDSYNNYAHDGTKTYYCTLHRTGTTLTLYLFNDAEHASPLDTLSIEVDDNDYRYFIPISGHDTSDNGYTFSAYVENIEIETFAWYDGWDYCKTITVNNTQVVGESPLTNFPILVNVTIPDTSHAQSDGDDFLFTLDNETKLNHEMEVYNSTTGHLVAWVNVTTLNDTQDTTIYMYYGNETCPSQENVAGTWDSHYEGVYHLVDATDSTSNHNGTNHGAVFNTGIIGGYCNVDDASNNYIDIAASTAYSLLNADKTIEAYAKIKEHSGSEAEYVVTLRENGGAILWYYGPTDNYQMLIQNTGTNCEPGSNSPVLNAWEYLAGTYDASTDTACIHVNGAFDECDDQDTEEQDKDSGDTIGFGGYCEADITEVRISNDIRSNGWLTTSANTIINSTDGQFLSSDNERDISGYTNAEQGTWNLYEKITIDKDFIDTTLTNFPILVPINATISAQCDGGNSIRFNDSTNTTEFAYEIEGTWNPSGTNYVWVNVTSVSADTDTIIWMRYNNSEATDAQNPSGVWDSNFVAVYHGVNLLDSTNNNKDLINSNTVLNDAQGIVSGGFDFDGSTSYMTNESDFADGFKTIEIFTKPDDDIVGNGATQTLWYSGDATVNDAKVAYGDFTSGYSGEVFGISGEGQTFIDDDVFSADGDYYNVVRWDGSTYDILINAVEYGTHPHSSGHASLVTNVNITLGRRDLGGGEQYYDGTMDEIRFSSSARSDAWINATFDALNQTSGFLTFGTPEEEQPEPPVEGYDGWTYYKTITVDNTKVWGESPLTNFPILVNTTVPISHVQEDGDDILFTLDNETKLNHEIELYDNSTGHLVAWVNVTTLYDLQDTVIYMYYGNETCPSQENVAGTWDSHYLGVWHMNDASGDITDSTSNNNDFSGGNSPEAYRATGKTGYAIDFESTNSDYMVGDNDFSGLSEITVTIVLKEESQVYSSPICSMDSFAAGQNSWFMWLDSPTHSNEDVFYVWKSDDTGGYAQSGNSSYGDWEILTGSWGGSNTYITFNGDKTSGTTIDSMSSSTQIKIGGNAVGSGYYFDGLIDEVRISNSERSSGWINTTYNSINDPDSFALYGEEQGGEPPPPNVWNKVLRIKIDHDMIDETLTNFPVLVPINATISAQCDGGNSIRFNDSTNTTEFAYEIEGTWNPSGTNYVWVNVTSVSSSVDTIIWMRYNNSQCSDAQNIVGTWNSDYIGVWHLTNLSDSTSNNYDFTNSGCSATSSGKIGGAYDWEHSEGDYMYQDTLLDTYPSSSLTFELWMNRETISQPYNMYTKFNSGTDYIYARPNTDDNYIRWDFADDVDAYHHTTQQALDTANTWYYTAIAMTDNQQGTSWVNDSVLTAGDNLLIPSDGTSKDFELGRYSWTATNEFDGKFDEFRISKVKRSSGWMNASYDTMNQTTDFLTFGPEPPAPSNNPPNTPTSPQCAGETNPTHLTDHTPDFTWAFSDNDIGDTQGGFHIQVGDDNNWTDGAEMLDYNASSNTTSSHTYNGSTLVDGGDYYWRVNTKDNNGAWGTWTSTQTFHMNTPPGKPTLLTPANNSIEMPFTTASVNLTWTNPGDDEGDSLNYWYQYAKDSDFSVDLVETWTGGPAYKNIPSAGELDRYTWYYWRVKAWDGLEWGVYSDWRKFETDNELNISIEPSFIDFGNVIFGEENHTSGYYFNITNHGLACHIQISVNDSTSWTYGNYSDLGLDTYSMNFSDDDWATETNIEDTGDTYLKTNLNSGNSFLFGLKLFAPLYGSHQSESEQTQITLTATAV